MKDDKTMPVNSEIKKLYEKYMEYNNTRSIIKKSEFKKYEILFKKHQNSENLDTDKLSALSKEFLLRINPYRPIHIVDDTSNNVILTLPPIFIPVKEIKSSFDNAFKKEQSILLNSNIPKHTTEAMKNIVTLIASSQGENIKEYEERIKEYRKITDNLINNFNEIKSQNIENIQDDNNSSISELKEDISEDNSNSLDDFFNSCHEE